MLDTARANRTVTSAAGGAASWRIRYFGANIGAGMTGNMPALLAP